MSDEKKTNDESVPAMLISFFKKLLGRDVLILVVATAAIAYATLKSRDSMAQSNQVQIDAGVKPWADETKRVANALEEHLKDDRDFRREVLRRLDESSADNRALYKTVLTGERQYRLERPSPVIPDGGP